MTECFCDSHLSPSSGQTVSLSVVMDADCSLVTQKILPKYYIMKLAVFVFLLKLIVFTVINILCKT